MWSGAPDVDYNRITSSDLNSPPQGWALDRVQITAGLYVTMAVGVVRGKPQRPIHSKEDDYSLRLLQLKETRFILCDVDACKSWLVNGLSTLLHLVRSRLAYAESDELQQGMLMMKASDFKAQGGRSGLKAAFETLRCNENRTLKLHHKGGPSRPGKTEKPIEDYYCLEDLIRSILDILEQIVDHQGDTRFEQVSVGYRVKASPWERLEGFDFMDLATSRRVISSRAMRLRPAGKGWVELTRALHAPTLFGRHFGEIVEPANTDQSSESCSACHWNEVMPPGRDLLAVQVEDLLKVCAREDSRLCFPNELCLDIPPLLFEPCSQYKIPNICQDHHRIRSLQRTSSNAQRAPEFVDAPTGFLAEMLLRVKSAWPSRKNENNENQPSSLINIPSDGAILLGMPRDSSEMHNQTIRRHLKRSFDHFMRPPSSPDEPQVAASPSRSNETTTNNLDSDRSREQAETTPPTHLSSPGLLPSSTENLNSPGSSIPASLQPSHEDSHRRKRARRRAEERTLHR